MGQFQLSDGAWGKTLLICVLGIAVRHLLHVYITVAMQSALWHRVMVQRLQSHRGHGYEERK